MKTAEKGRTSVTEGIPAALPALLLAAKLLNRSGGLDVEIPARASAESVLAGMTDEADLGELLLAIAAVSRDRGWDPESALRGAARAHAMRIRAVEGVDPPGR